VSPYVYVANGPILLYDPDGKRIKIVYRDEDGKKHKAFYDSDKGVAVNKKGDVVNGDFLDKVVESLNYSKKGDEKGIIDAVAKHKKTVKIKETKQIGEESFTGALGGLINTVKYNPNSGLKLAQKSGSITYPNGNVENSYAPTDDVQTPALGLFHEMVHAYNYLFDRAAMKKRNKTKDSDYDNAEERRVIEGYETPAAKILGEGVRTNHRGYPVRTVGPTSLKL
jgi:hypothetical protein